MLFNHSRKAPPTSDSRCVCTDWYLCFFRHVPHAPNANRVATDQQINASVSGTEENRLATHQHIRASVSLKADAAANQSIGFFIGNARVTLATKPDRRVHP